mgnify:FL=1
MALAAKRPVAFAPFPDLKMFYLFVEDGQYYVPFSVLHKVKLPFNTLVLCGESDKGDGPPAALTSSGDRTHFSVLATSRKAGRYSGFVKRCGASVWVVDPPDRTEVEAMWSAHFYAACDVVGLP